MLFIASYMAPLALRCKTAIGYRPMLDTRVVVLAGLMTCLTAFPRLSRAQTGKREEQLTITYRPMRVDSSAILQRIFRGGAASVSLEIDSTGRAIGGSVQVEDAKDSILGEFATQLVGQMTWDPETARRVANQDVTVPFVFIVSVAGQPALLEEGTGSPGVAYFVMRSDSASPATAEALVTFPKRASGPQPWYPPQLQEAQVDGDVMVEALIDTLGHVEKASVRIVSSNDRGFEESAREVIERSVFQVTRTPWRALRVRVRVPITYRIKH